jgi:hypothetical protein
MLMRSVLRFESPVFGVFWEGADLSDWTSCTDLRSALSEKANTVDIFLFCHLKMETDLTFQKGCILFSILHVQWTKSRSQCVIWLELPCDKNGKHICSWVTNIGQKMTLALKVLMCIINKHLIFTNLNCITCWHRNITITCNVGTYRVHTAVLWL